MAPSRSSRPRSQRLRLSALYTTKDMFRRFSPARWTQRSSGESGSRGQKDSYGAHSRLSAERSPLLRTRYDTAGEAISPAVLITHFDRRERDFAFLMTSPS